MREVLERFDFDNTISKLDEAGLLFQVLERFRTVDLHPYNTGIATYVWLLTNRRAPARRGLVQLIDATAFWSPMRRSLGDKRRGIPPDKAADVLKLLADCRDGETRVLARNGKDEERIVSRIFPTTRFGIPKITVERPLRLNFQASAERIAHLEEQKGFQNLAKSKKRGEAGTREEAEGRARQQAILGLLERLPDTLHKDRAAFLAILTTAVRKASVKLRAPVLNAILAALAERDETAAICRDKDGMPEPDPELRDSERVPLVEGEDPADDEGVPFRITSPARTVVDCFRYRNKFGLDVALEALHDVLRSRAATVGEIMRAAEACRARTVMRTYLEALWP